MHYYDIQGVKLTALANQFGTPLYVYDANKIIEKIAILRDSFKEVNIKIKYACKANTNLSILKLMRKHGVEIDVVSPQELQLALMAGYEGSQITFTPSGVSFDEIELAAEAGARINLDNLDVLEQFGQKYGNTKGALIRIKPHVFGGGNEKIMTAHPESKFGISIHQKDQILDIVKKYDMKIIGLHQHTGSDVKNADAFTQAASAILEMAFDFKDLEIIDLGGGFKVAYKDGDIVTDMAEVGQVLSDAFLKFSAEYGRPLQLWFEPGKFLVSEAGTFLTTTNAVKVDPIKTFVCVNSGLNHLGRPMMYGAYHDIFNASNENTQELEDYRVVGYICETDTFSWSSEGKQSERTMSKVSKGDIIAMKNAGAYCYSMASQYNSRVRPAEVLVYEGEAKLIRKRETFDDILRNTIEIDL
ncbi:diaminopimelate decarboxylase [Flectobacillus major]|jgi:diaminopimelate decarboxylase|uniref:diaminopimelate decarboxylase n=1 Tax=Flectobacillus major TaxID=103 RepID=UPI000410F898|nr:diaminopimelate decarboxylase [Flectobacillus major]